MVLGDAEAVVKAVGTRRTSPGRRMQLFWSRLSHGVSLAGGVNPSLRLFYRGLTRWRLEGRCIGRRQPFLLFRFGSWVVWVVGLSLHVVHDLCAYTLVSGKQKQRTNK